jgi:flagellar biosynthesis protein
MIVNRIRFGNEKKKSQGELQASALGYDPLKDSAPRVLAKGRGQVAQNIIDLAIANGIPIQEDPILTAALSTIDVNEEIPPELYAVVAEVFAYIYRIRGKTLPTK